MKKHHLNLLWLIPAVPALWQLSLLCYAVAVRWRYPYDLEWMEGGMLTHALRFSDGHSIYTPPSVDFVPQLYTPLYPITLALLGKIFGLGYALGRGVSIAALVATLALGARAIVREARGRIHGPDGRPGEKPTAWAGAALMAGFVAAAYPFLACFYDLVRVDMFFMAMGLAGLVVLRGAARAPCSGLHGAGPGFWHPGVAVAATILALSFFAKQTGVMFVAAGGVALLFMNWRAVPVYGLFAAAVGGGGAWAFNTATNGWFWFYAYRVHQSHDTNEDRFWVSFKTIGEHFPWLTLVIAGTLVLVILYTAARRRLPPGGAGFLYWTWLFVCGAIIGAVGWATQWAIYNAYLPAMIFGAIAAGAALVPLASMAHELAPSLRPVVAGGVALLLAWQLVESRWTPRRPDDKQWAKIRGGDLADDHVWLPTRADEAAGDALIARLAAIDGDVFFPSHPWYPRLAGKQRAFVHRIGIKDVTSGAPGDAARKVKPKKPLIADTRDILRLETSLRDRRFAAIVLDDGEPSYDYPGLAGNYRQAPDGKLGRGAGPRTYYGKATTPGAVLLAISRTDLPLGTRSMVDFENGRLDGWTKTGGTAWGTRAEDKPLEGQPPVRGAGGRYWASSMHGGDAAVGALTSTVFELRGRALQLRVAGGKDAAQLRVELVNPGGGRVLRSATGPGTESMTVVDWDVSDLTGQRVQLRLADESTAGHLDVDEIREIGP